MLSEELEKFINDNVDLIEGYPKTASEIQNKMWEQSTTFKDGCANEIRKLTILLHYLKFGVEHFVLNGITQVRDIKIVICDTDSAVDFYKITVGLKKEAGGQPLTEKDIRDRLYEGLVQFTEIPPKVAKPIAYSTKISKEVIARMGKYRRLRP